MVLVVATFGGGQPLRAQSTYPSWFKTTPSSGASVLWAVGYAPGYSDLADGMEEAKTDAYESLRRARRVVVIGEKLYEAAPGFRTSLEGERFVETGLPDTLRSVAYVDSVKAAGMTLVLAAWSESSAPSLPASMGRSSFSAQPPAWVQTAMSGSLSGQRAVGTAPRYYNLENSWERAEKRARQKLAFEAASRIRSLDKKTEDWRHDVRSVTTGVDLRHVQVMARWANEENCYVLASGRVEDVLLK